MAADQYTLTDADLAAAKNLRRRRREDVVTRIGLAPFTGGVSLGMNPLEQVARQRALTNYQYRQGAVDALGQNEQFYYGQEQSARLEHLRREQAAILASIEADLQAKGIDANSAQARAANAMRAEWELRDQKLLRAQQGAQAQPSTEAFLQQDVFTLKGAGRGAGGGRPLTNEQALAQAKSIVGAEDPERAYNPTKPLDNEESREANLLAAQLMAQSLTGPSGAPVEGLPPEAQAASEEERLAYVQRAYAAAFAPENTHTPGNAGAQFRIMLQAAGIDYNQAVNGLKAIGREDLAKLAKDDDTQGQAEQLRLREEATQHDENALAMGKQTYAGDRGLSDKLTRLDALSQEWRTETRPSGAPGEGLPEGVSVDARGMAVDAQGAPLQWDNLPLEQAQALQSQGFTNSLGIVVRPAGTQGEELLRSLDIVEQFPTFGRVQEAKTELMNGPLKAFMQANSLENPDIALKQFMKQARLQTRAQKIVDREVIRRGVAKGMVPNVPKRLAGVVEQEAAERGMPTSGVGRLAQAVSRKSAFSRDEE